MSSAQVPPLRVLSEFIIVYIIVVFLTAIALPLMFRGTGFYIAVPFLLAVPFLVWIAAYAPRPLMAEWRALAEALVLKLVLFWLLIAAPRIAGAPLLALMAFLTAAMPAVWAAVRAPLPYQDNGPTHI